MVGKGGMSGGGGGGGPPISLVGVVGVGVRKVPLPAVEVGLDWLEGDMSDETNEEGSVDDAKDEEVEGAKDCNGCPSPSVVVVTMFNSWPCWSWNPLTLSTVSLSWDKCWWMLSGSERSKVATLTVAEIVCWIA